VNADLDTLDRLKSEGVFQVKWDDLEPGMFTVTECCDYHLSLNLSPAELKKLGHEIIALAEDKL